MKKKQLEKTRDNSVKLGKTRLNYINRYERVGLRRRYLSFMKQHPLIRKKTR